MPPAKKTTPAPRQPQDRQKKATTSKVTNRLDTFEFEHDGETYELPSPQDSVGKIPGRILRDALMDPESGGELRMSIAALEACDPDEDALDALYSKPAPEMMQIVAEWFQSAQGAELGES